jgi:hypothetical protein
MLVSVDDYLAGELIPLGEIGIELPLAEIYDGVTFSPEPEAEG